MNFFFRWLSLDSLWRRECEAFKIILTVILSPYSWPAWQPFPSEFVECKESWIESTFFALGPHSFLGLIVTQLVDSKLLLHRMPHSLFIAFWLVVSLLFGVYNEKNYTSRNSLAGISNPRSLLVVFNKCLSVFGWACCTKQSAYVVEELRGPAPKKRPMISG